VAEFVHALLAWVAQYGFLAIFFLMTLESACIPVPSEPVMVYGGFLVFSGQITFLEASLAGTLGNLAGSLIAYGVGVRGSAFVTRAVERRGVTAYKVHRADEFFHKWGEPSVLIGRMLPVIRTFISLPAGIARMDWRRFVAYTLIGSFPWNAGLVWAGLAAGRHWEQALAWLHEANYVLLGVVALLLIAAGAWWMISRRRGAEPEDAGDASAAGPGSGDPGHPERFAAPGPEDPTD
jgi:membrane protein DedA with SNARE-associated domain